MATDWIGGVPAALVGVPLLGLLACLALPRLGSPIASLTAAGVLALTLAAGLGGGIGTSLALGGWPAPLGVVLRLDALAFAFVAVTAAIFALVTPAARDILARPEAPPLWLGLLTGMMALFVSGDLFNLFVALEVAGLSAVALTALGGSAQAARAAFGYLCVSLTGGLLYLAAVALLYRATGTLDLDQVAAAGLEGEGLAAALALATAGLLLKTGAAPLHRWLPPAHGAATAGVSAVLSGVVVKGSLYILLRLWMELAPPALWESLGPWLVLLGLFGAATGSFGAIKAERLKPMIAYSTVAQIGYMVLAFGVAAEEPRALGAVLAFVAAHAFAKAALFLAAGDMVRANGHDEVARLADPGPAWGPSRGAMAIAAAALIGLPPTGGFAAKWTLAQAGLEGGYWWMPVVLALGGLTTAVYMARLTAALMRVRPVESAGAAEPIEAGRRGWAALALALVALGLGFASLPLAALVGGAA